MPHTQESMNAVQKATEHKYRHLGHGPEMSQKVNEAVAAHIEAEHQADIAAVRGLSADAILTNAASDANQKPITVVAAPIESSKSTIYTDAKGVVWVQTTIEQTIDVLGRQTVGANARLSDIAEPAEMEALLALHAKMHNLVLHKHGMLAKGE